jgi:hypothetical protein
MGLARNNYNIGRMKADVVTIQYYWQLYDNNMDFRVKLRKIILWARLTQQDN